MNGGLQKHQPILRNFAGWSALLLYLAALSPAGAALMALVAAVAPEHQLQIGCSESGVALVLHHQGNCATHHHGRAARVLTLFANLNGSTNQDHVIQFSSPTAATPDARITAPGLTPSEDVGLMADLGFCPAALQKTPAIAFPRPPPRAGQILCLRTTVLLI